MWIKTTRWRGDEVRIVLNWPQLLLTICMSFWWQVCTQWYSNVCSLKPPIDGCKLGYSKLGTARTANKSVPWVCHKHFSCSKFICLMVESACWLISLNCWTTRPIPNIMFLPSVVTSCIRIPTISQFVLLQPTQAGNEEMVAKSARGASERTQARFSKRGCLSLRKWYLLPFGPPFVPTNQKCALPSFSPLFCNSTWTVFEGIWRL